jgi:hypothetical protein
MSLQERPIRQQERRLPAPRVRVGVLASMTGVVLAAGMALAATPGPVSEPRITLAAAAHAARVPGRGRAVPRLPLRVLSISPSYSADAVTAADPVRVVFSAALAKASPLPTFSPAVAGTWHAAGGAMVFTPAAPVPQGTELTLRVPAGSSGVRSEAGAVLAGPVTAVFQAGGWSTLRLEQLLAQLGYLPLTWTPDNDSDLPVAPSQGPVTLTYTRLPTRASAPARAGFSWQGSYPAALTRQWQPGRPGVLLTGALMAFQADQGLPLTGTATLSLVRALLRAVTRGQRNPHGYTYALADQARPETLTVWHDGQIVAQTLASTGTALTPTPDGTFPVYLRNRFQVMRGLLPDGIPYAEPVHFVSFFDGNYAVHSMDRASFGWPQSLGCIELPLAEARLVWRYLSYGSLVTVTA